MERSEAEPRAMKAPASQFRRLTRAMRSRLSMKSGDSFRPRPLALLMLAAALSSCIPIEYTTAPNGSLQSIGLPGVPVWQTDSLAKQKREAASGDLAARPGTTVDSKAESLIAIQSGAPWLAEVNRARTAAGDQSAGENAGLSNAAAEHARYLVEGGPTDQAKFQRYAAGLGPLAHTEIEVNNYWSPEGEEAGRHGEISWLHQTPIEDVDSLLLVPFHRIAVLAPWQKAAGYGAYGYWPRRVGVLVMRGATATGLSTPVLYPPDGATVSDPAMAEGEFPDPLKGCPGYSYPIGLPITVQLGAYVNVHLIDYSVTDDTAGSKIEACAFDSATYPNHYGQNTLLSYGALIIIPRQPLVSGHEYRVNVQLRGHAFNWTFHAG